MNYNFYADKIDKIEILEFLFKETDLRIYDLGSSYDHEICEYKSVNELTQKFDFLYGGEFSLKFQLWTPRHKGKVLFRKIDLDPKQCNGHKYRFSAEGWGLIQLYFGGQIKKELNQSHIGHFSEKGAFKWEDSNLYYGKVDKWDWKEIQRTSGMLKYKIHNKMSIRKIGTHGVLNGANILSKQGFKL